MPIPKQRANSLNFSQLKGIRNLVIDFNPHLITAIMGVNGSGKSTILHALACCYKPYTNSGSIDYTFPKFFAPNTDARWAGSQFDLNYSHDLPAPHTGVVRYRKAVDRWVPRKPARLQRYVSYIGIVTAVPTIEVWKTEGFIHLTRVNRNDPTATRILIDASYILNRPYDQLSRNTTGNGNSMVGVRMGMTSYTAISMGSGEQRIFKILDEIYKAPEYALILIDELELLLHTDAFKKLLIVLDRIARAKHLQIIFTSHSEITLTFKDKINIRHIFATNTSGYLCFKDANSKVMYHLTGNQQKPIKLLTEDDLAKTIVAKVAADLGIRKEVEFGIFGPAINCFTAVGGAVLNDINILNSLFILDGDLYTTPAEKKDRVNSVLTGTDYASRRKKVIALQHISQLNLPVGQSPERYLHTVLINMPPQASDEHTEIINAAQAMQAVIDPHELFDAIINRLGYERSEGLSKVIDLLATDPFWPGYTLPIRNWLNAKKVELGL